MKIKQCWWQWENAHHERVDRARRRGDNLENAEGPKCCLCNRVVEQFVDGKGDPAHNPEPFVAADDGEENSGFFDWLFRRGQNRGADRSSSAQNGSGPNDLNGAMEYLEQMAQRGASVMGMDAAVLLDQLRFGGGFPVSMGLGGASPSSTNNNGNPFDLGRMFQEWGAGGGPFDGQPRSNQVNSTQQGSFNQIRSGSQIVIQDLVNSQHLNGQRGRVQRIDQQTGRYLIQLNSNNVTISLKPENILQILSIKILGLVSQPQLNGKEGTIVSYNSERNRYVVRVSLPSEMKEISIKSSNIRIPDLTKVRLEGLESQPQWNGRYGTIMKWENGRYQVRLSNMYSVMVRVENVRL